ncbi:MAG: nicotinamide-nucleotide adenylyltransferase [Candidatus Altiarchaeum hamiconexum]|uniref:Nicotinamide-nucleotide adenylyltransferase n=1 Tax=Candidatus Altarchaeum hamiconexum TaxID=1803513 RepID=A0A8J7YZM4_9ARCH|nr:nicotinamide-nucleotide adenylyltransferase [Candidatus Altarchaeum hamiconexum]NCT01439.1 nicotinamide-nucleotide adenylyltransferase [Candidatus Altarchaeum hamiconexum]
MRALFVGRFQPLHPGHIKAIIEISKKYEVIVVVGSAQENYTAKNPFTAGERAEMIIREENFKNLNLNVIPVSDINNHTIWVKYIISLLPKFDIVYTRNPLTKILFEKEGFEVTAQKIYTDEYGKIYSGTNIRNEILNKHENIWKKMISESAYKFIKEIKGDERIINLSDSNKQESHSGKYIV